MQPHRASDTQHRQMSFNRLYPWLMLISRSILFLLAQGLIALAVLASGARPVWNEAGRWWPFMAIFANLGSLFLLVRLYKAEGKNFWESLRFSRQTWKTDLLWLLGFSVIGLPLAALPREPLGTAIFGDPMISTRMLFQPLPDWAVVVSFLFPLTIWFSELPTYFGYCMPRLFAGGKSKKHPALGWLAWIIASFFIAAQHIFLPFLLNGGYLLWRFAMFLPFALITGLVLKLRPGMMPYLAAGHVLMDISTVLVYWMI